VRSRTIDKAVEAQALKDLERFGLVAARHEATPQSNVDAAPPGIPNVTRLIPRLMGRNVEEHFQLVGERLVQPYLDLLNSLLASSNNIPPPPTHWQLRPGWVRLVGIGTSIQPVFFY
jgi:hypothetical protein